MTLSIPQPNDIRLMAFNSMFTLNHSSSKFNYNSIPNISRRLLQSWRHDIKPISLLIPKLIQSQTWFRIKLSSSNFNSSIQQTIFTSSHWITIKKNWFLLLAWLSHIESTSIIKHNITIKLSFQFMFPIENQHQNF